MMSGIYSAVGLMSGTSLDGIDCALIWTDGRSWVETGPSLTLPYDGPFRECLRALLGGRGAVSAVERELTDLHAVAVRQLLRMAGKSESEIDLIGFHGHTILHAPEEMRTWQIGDGGRLAELTGIPVINDFRTADMLAGGQGAPLVPLFHQALASELERPLAVLNVGGVANITWIGRHMDQVMAFDTGPGNALIDDWTLRHTGASFDQDGRLAAQGKVDPVALSRLLQNPYFPAKPPKSLDRDAWNPAIVAEMSPADGAATLTEFTAAAVEAALPHLPEPPVRWLVTGGGRRNGMLMSRLAARLKAPLEPVEAVGWDGDALEAQAFAYLAVRSLLGLPLTLPGTTGVRAPQLGGRFHPAPA